MNETITLNLNNGRTSSGKLRPQKIRWTTSPRQREGNAQGLAAIKKRMHEQRAEYEALASSHGVKFENYG